MKNKYITVIYGFLFLVLSIVITKILMTVRYSESELTFVVKTVYEITKGYRINQIVASMGMYLVGFVVTYPMCVKLGKCLPFLLAMPVGNALWGVISSFLLFLNIPYNKVTTLILAAIIILVLFVRYKEIYKNIDVINTLNLLMVVLAVIVMASCGLFPKNYSYDSFYYVMQYGQLIAKTGRLSSDIVGTYMTWTGITPALTSAYAAMFGFETIYAIHHLLVFSMYGFIMYCAYQGAVRFCTRKKAWVFTLLTLFTVVFTPIVTGLAMWIISNTYFMVYIVFLVMLPVIAGEKMDMHVICLMSLFAAWMTLCRIEAAPYMCFLVICVTCLKIPRMQGIMLFLSILVSEVLYFLKMLNEYLVGDRVISQKLLTADTIAVILIVFFLTGIYFLLYNLKIVRFMRRYMAVFGIIALMLGCFGLGLFDWEKFANNATVAVKNIVTNWYWPLPTAILACEILKTCYKCRNQYFDLTIWGSVLFNFALSMGRTQYLRLGSGDSYHRICMSLVPLYIVSTIYIFLVCFEGQKHLAKTKGV